MVLLLAAVAALASMGFAAPATRNLVPVAFIGLVVLVAVRYGSVAGMVGSLAGAAIFARWLYAPVGSLHIQDAAARDHLGWMLLAGISLSYLLAAPDPGEKSEHK